MTPLDQMTGWPATGGPRRLTRHRAATHRPPPVSSAGPRAAGAAGDAPAAGTGPQRHTGTAAGSPGPGVLVVVGDLLEDVVVWVPGPVEKGTDNPAVVHRVRGGSAANVAAWAAQRVPARFIGCVGDDPLGEQLAGQLTKAGVDVRVQRKGRTGSVVILVDRSGERTMMPDRAAAAELSEVPHAWLAGAQIVHLPAYGLIADPAASAIERLGTAARGRGIGLTMDASSVGSLRTYGVERFHRLLRRLRPCVLFANTAEAGLLQLGRIRPHAGCLFIVKDGSGPTTIIDSTGARTTVAVPPVSAVRDSTGAGDAFAAGYLTAHLLGTGPVLAVESGHRFAQRVLTRPGAGERAGHDRPGESPGSL